MCTGLFSCMDQKHVIFRQQLAKLDSALETGRRDERTASTILTIADTLSRVLDEPSAELDADADPAAELRGATMALYDAAGDLFDEPTSAGRWQKIHQLHDRTRRVFETELERLHRHCGAIGAPVT